MNIKFPKDFVFGASTSAFQIEGATKEDGRGEHFFDQIFKLPEFAADPNIACDHYHRYKEDVQLMKQLGLQSYRFSISWVRVYPTGTGPLNEKGLKFYHNLITELLANGIEPVACLNHFELPMPLFQKGWQHIDTINAFKKFGTTCFERFGDRVKLWATFNEPWIDQFFIPYASQEFTMQKLSKRQSKKTIAKCLNNLHGLFKSHAEVVKAFRTIIPEGKIGIILNLNPGYPVTDSSEDQEAAKRFDEFLNDWQLDLVLNGEYPETLFNYFQETLDAPNINPTDKILFKDGAVDYLGVNFYGPAFIKASENHYPLNYEDYKEDRSRVWANNAKVVPEALHEILVRIHKKYDAPTLWITENGCSFGNEKLDDEKDEWRLDYIKQHLAAVKHAMDDGVNIERYYVWSLMDNLEWVLGYEERYGIIYINRENDLTRTIKKSGHWYSDVIKNREFTL